MTNVDKILSEEIKPISREVTLNEKDQYILFLDPGKRTGWARFSLLTGKLAGCGILTGVDELHKFFMMNSGSTAPKRVVYEAYRIRNNALNEGKLSRFQREGHEIPLIVIGRITQWADTLEIPHETVETSKMKMAFLTAGFEIPQGHPPDDKVAVAYGVQWLVEKNIRVPKRPDFDPSKSSLASRPTRRRGRQ